MRRLLPGDQHGSVRPHTATLALPWGRALSPHCKRKTKAQGCALGGGAGLGENTKHCSWAQEPLYCDCPQDGNSQVLEGVCP